MSRSSRNFLRRWLLFTVTIMYSLLSSNILPAMAFSLQGDGAALIDVTSGRMLYDVNSDRHFYPASITKIVTALVVLDHLPLDERVRVSPQAAAQEGSSMHLRPGDELKVIDLLYGMMLTSGNDAAYALAEAVAGHGRIDRFAQFMNAIAEEAGAKNSHFRNPSGLPDPEHVTTASDMAKIARFAMIHYPVFRDIVRSPSHQVTFSDGRTVTVYNHNAGLASFGFDGIKTGYTSAARHTFVGSMTRDDWPLVAVTLRTSKSGKYTDANTLFRYGYEHFTPIRLGGRGDPVDYLLIRASPVQKLPVFVKENTIIPLRRDGSEAVVYRFKYFPSQLEPPIHDGQYIGILHVSVNDEFITSYPLYAGASIEAWPPTQRPVWQIILSELWRLITRLTKLPRGT